MVAPPPLALRPVAREDRPACRLLLAVRNRVLAHDPLTEEVLDEFDEQLAWSLDLVAFAGSEAVGVATVAPLAFRPTSHVAYAEVAVLPSFRGRGAGAALLRRLQTEAAARGKAELALDV